jgi:hypothetical protein
MPSNSVDLPRTARWLVCESSGRWSLAVRRFCAELLPPVGIPCLVSNSPQETLRLISMNTPSAVLWELTRESLPTGCDSLIQAAKLTPQPLQLVASCELSARQQLSLLELPVGALVRHPEDLRRLKPMFQGYFARHRQLLD